MGKPRGIKIANADHSDFETGGAIFVFANVSKGVHTVKVLFRSHRDGSLVYAQDRSLAVEFKGQPETAQTQ